MNSYRPIIGLVAALMLPGCAGFDWGQIATQLSSMAGGEMFAQFRVNAKSVEDYQARMELFDTTAFNSCMAAAQAQVDSGKLGAADAAAAYIPCRTLVSSDPPTGVWAKLSGMFTGLFGDEDEPVGQPESIPDSED